MKILHYIASTGRGGAENQFVALANAQSERAEVCVLLPAGAAWADQLSPAVEACPVVDGSRWNPRLYLQVAAAIRRLGPDVVHTHGAKASRIVHSLCRPLGCCQVATKHNSRKGRVFERIANVTAVSRSAAASIGHDSALIYNAISPLPVQSTRAQDGVFRMVAVGRLDPIKGFDILVRQCAKLTGEWRLDILGEGQHGPVLQALVEELQLGERVRLPGHCENVPQAMADADLVAISSHSEGFSLAAIEALFYARLLVSTPVGGSEEVLPESLLADQQQLADKIEAVRGDYATYRALFDEARDAWRPRLLLPAVARQYLDYYEKVCRGGNA